MSRLSRLRATAFCALVLLLVGSLSAAAQRRAVPRHPTPPAPAVAVRGHVFVGGYFDSVSGLSRSHLALLDAVTGQPLSWTAEPDREVLSLAVRETVLFVGGRFGTIGGQARNRLAAVSANNGQALPWDATLERLPPFIFDGGPRVSCLIVRDTVPMTVALDTAGLGVRVNPAVVRVRVPVAAIETPPATSGGSRRGS